MDRLSKREVERLLAEYDRSPTAALAAALGRLLDRPGAAWADLVALAPLGETRRAALLAGDPAALDALAAELNECRSLG